MAQRGGKRENSGLPKGYKFPETIKKEEAKKAMQVYILKRLEPLLRAQTSLARGLQFVYKLVDHKDEKGRTIKREHVLLEDKEQIRRALDVIEELVDSEDGEYYYITAKPPDIRAIDSMLDRTFGRAMQSLEIENPSENEGLKEANDKLNKIIENGKLLSKQFKRQDSGT